MSAGSRRSSTAPLLPLVLLTAALAEEILWAYIHDEIRSTVPRVIVRMMLVGVVYSFAADFVEPWLRGLFSNARKVTTKKVGRRFGPWPFYAVVYALLFLGYYVLEKRGPEAFLL